MLQLRVNQSLDAVDRLLPMDDQASPSLLCQSMTQGPKETHKECIIVKHVTESYSFYAMIDHACH